MDGFRVENRGIFGKPGFFDLMAFSWIRYKIPRPQAKASPASPIKIKVTWDTSHRLFNTGLAAMVVAGRVATTATTPGGRQFVTNLYVLTVATGAVDVLAADINGTEVQWSPAPESTLIAYVAEDRRLTIIDADSGTRHPLINYTRRIGQLTWSPDGRFLAFSSDRGGAGYEIFIVDVNSYATYQVTVNDVFDMVNDWVE